MELKSLYFSQILRKGGYVATLGDLRKINKGVLFYRDPIRFADFWDRYTPVRRKVLEAFCKSRGLSISEAGRKNIPDFAPLGEEGDNALAELKRFIIEDELGPPISIFVH